MRVLVNYCAIIFPNVILHNGLSSISGMLAVFGHGEVAHSLIREGTVSKKYGMGEMFYGNPGEINLIHSDSKTYQLCVSEHIGTKGLEAYLKNLGFNEGKDTHIREAARNFMYEEVEKLNHGTKSMYIHTPNMGRSIAAAVTMGHIRLSGHATCANNANNKAPYELQMKSPLNMGYLKVIAWQELTGRIRCLIYINGNLRLLSKKTAYLKKEKSWDIYPKLDLIGSKELMSREILDDFLNEQFDEEAAGIDFCDDYLIDIGKCSQLTSLI